MVNFASFQLKDLLQGVECLEASPELPGVRMKDMRSWRLVPYSFFFTCGRSTALISDSVSVTLRTATLTRWRTVDF